MGPMPDPLRVKNDRSKSRLHLNVLGAWLPLLGNTNSLAEQHRSSHYSKLGSMVVLVQA